MLRLINLFFGALLRMLYSRRDLLLEHLALRQQLAVLHSRHPRPRFRVQDKLFWVAALRWWSSWKRVLVVVTSETVVRWRRAGFRLYWTRLSRHQVRTGGGVSAGPTRKTQMEGQFGWAPTRKLI
jgi:hypothetical protein